MGCVSSKLLAKEIDREKRRDYIHHVVSLTSSTYGVLKLDKEWERETEKQGTEERPPLGEEPPEIINAWELMEGLEEVMGSRGRSPKPRNPEARSPFKLLNRVGGSPRKARKAGGGKENSPGAVLKECGGGDLKKPSPRLWASINVGKRRGESPASRRSLGPSLEPYERRCPPGGEDAVVLYTTTLRGVRRTFEECNAARSALESQGVRVSERDVSMHSAFREELRAVTGSREVRVPLVFVRGRLIGGAEEVLRLEEEGRLGALLGGIPRAAPGCGGCGGVRFVMCGGCSGSCKVRGDGGAVARCGECNENGLIQCPVCVV